ncbi:recombinase family protein [Ruminococcus sp. Marseille-P6503]|uniref:recombinase family protein n=1 Tax=Ruminococcus sp. Marseille-P6503 TaxID=2364796 RepID=UPI0013DDD8D8|nr:recombinase family protein [Ruminococcus sp. Marseille-P6503]
MPKNRVIPFGYCMRNGEITAEPKEVYAVSTIFSEYLKGGSLLQIAKLMESEKIRYTADSEKWNKNMVKRIIENEKYLGNDKYPRIIDENIFKQANEKRVRKAAALNLICDDLKEIRRIAYCAECGGKLFRKTNGKGREYWNCSNQGCFKFEYRLTDQMIIGAVLTAMNSVIANPNLLDTKDEICTYKPTSSILRQQNEISRMTDSPQVDFEKVKSEIFRLAEMKYERCTYSDKPQKTAELVTLFINHNQLNTLDIGLFKSCINKILISRFCTIEVEFINGIKIKNTIRRENDEHSAECKDNTCENADS